MKRHQETVHNRDLAFVQQPQEQLQQEMAKKIFFEHPFTMLIAGPTQSGKTTWFKQVLESNRIRPQPQRILWFYAQWQPLYESMKGYVEFHRGIPDWINQPNLLDQRANNVMVFDDLMESVADSKTVSHLFTEGSHHRNLSVVLFLQNVFPNGRQSRNISLNAQYIVLFRNPRDLRQVSYLSQQLYPQKSQEFVQYFNQVTAQQPYTAVVLNLKTNASEDERVTVEKPIMDMALQTVQQSVYQPVQQPVQQPMQPMVMTMQPSPQASSLMSSFYPPPNQSTAAVNQSSIPQMQILQRPPHSAQMNEEDISQSFALFSKGKVSVEDLMIDYRLFVKILSDLEDNRVHQSIQGMINQMVNQMMAKYTLLEAIEKTLKTRQGALEEMYSEEPPGYEQLKNFRQEDDDSEETSEETSEEGSEDEDDNESQQNYNQTYDNRRSRMMNYNDNQSSSTNKEERNAEEDEDDVEEEDEEKHFERFKDNYKTYLLLEKKMATNPLHQSILKRSEDLKEMYGYSLDDAVYTAIQERYPSFKVIQRKLQEEDDDDDDSSSDSSDEVEEEGSSTDQEK